MGIRCHYCKEISEYVWEGVWKKSSPPMKMIFMGGANPMKMYKRGLLHPHQNSELSRFSTVWPPLLCTVVLCTGDVCEFW